MRELSDSELNQVNGGILGLVISYFANKPGAVARANEFGRVTGENIYGHRNSMR